ncbi:MAG: AI-2E family transporter [Candidatus Woesearchaeota archaeon]
MKDKIKSISVFFIVLIIFYLVYIMIKPFFVSIIIAAFLAYLFYPLYNKLEKYNNNFSAFFTLFLIILIIVLPTFFFSLILIKELPKTYLLIQKDFQSDTLLIDINNFLSKSPLNINLNNLIQNFFNQLFLIIKNFVLFLPLKLINLFLTFFLLFFFLRDGKLIIQKIMEFSPFSEKETLIFLREIKNITDAVFFGQVLTAFIQSIVAFIGLTFLGYDSAFLFSLITFFVAIIPMIGPSFVYLPLSIFNILSGLNSNNMVEFYKGVYLLLYGLLIISSVDNVIKPFVISDKTSSHPIIIMLGILGGLFTFGFIGIIIGPIIFIILEILFRMYKLKMEIKEHAFPLKNKKKEVEI